MKRGKDVTVCVVGAGPSGITAAKHLLQVGIPPENITVYDKHDQVGGNWIYSPDPEGHSSVYETSHIISSKSLSEYHDYPMPESYPDYPGHEQLLQYFQSYATHFGVTKLVEFGTTVEKAEMNDDYTWDVTLASGETSTFDYFIAANGHHWNPRYPEFSTEFAGEYMHSHYYRTNLPFKDKRVLIIGAGNSACDIAVDVCRHAEFTALSWRRGYWVIPKFLFGRPPDVINAKMQFLPESLRTWLLKSTIRLAVGSMEKYGLPEPDHAPTESHPILNGRLLYHLRHGNIHHRKEIEEFRGKDVYFEDGKVEEYDVVIAATGYKITFPFFDYPELDFSEATEIPMYLKMFHPKYPSMAIIGMTQPQGCIWPLSDTQGRLMANYIIGNYDWPDNINERIEKEMERNRKRYLDTPRHSTEVDYHRYLKKLRKQLPNDAPEWSAPIEPLTIRS